MNALEMSMMLINYKYRDKEGRVGVAVIGQRHRHVMHIFHFCVLFLIKMQNFISVDCFVDS